MFTSHGLFCFIISLRRDIAQYDLKDRCRNAEPLLILVLLIDWSCSTHIGSCREICFLEDSPTMCWQRDELLCLFLFKCDLVCGSHTRQPGRHCSSTEETPLFISNHTSVSLGKAKLRLFFPTEFPRWPSQTGAVTHRATGRERCG